MDLIPRYIFSFSRGDPIAIVEGGTFDGELFSVADTDLPLSSKESSDGDIGPAVNFKRGRMVPIMPTGERSIEFIAGPSGCGKSTFAAGLIERYLALRPGSRVLFFSRTNASEDPAYSGVSQYMNQVDVTAEGFQESVRTLDLQTLEKGTVLVFDDIFSITDNAAKESILKVASDAMQIGRKLGIYVILTSHLVIPTEKNFARLLMMEMQYLTIFPSCGGKGKIEYVLLHHVQLEKKQAKRINDSKGRWVRLHVAVPRFVMEDNLAYFL